MKRQFRSFQLEQGKISLPESSERASAAEHDRFVQASIAISLAKIAKALERVEITGQSS